MMSKFVSDVIQSSGSDNSDLLVTVYLNELGSSLANESGVSFEALGAKRVSQDKLNEVIENDSLIVLPLYLNHDENVRVGSACDVSNSDVCGVVFASKEKVRQALGAKRLGKHVLKRAIEFVIAQVQGASEALAEQDASNQGKAA
jgi:hypothetical protein